MERNQGGYKHTTILSPYWWPSGWIIAISTGLVLSYRMEALMWGLTTVRKLLYPLVKGECTLLFKQKWDEFIGHFLSCYIETDIRLRIVHVKRFFLLLISISSGEGFDKKEIEIATSFSIAMKFKYMYHLSRIRSTPTFKDLAHWASFLKRAFGQLENGLSIKSRLNLIVRVNVVLNKTVVVDSDWCFDNLCGSHLQSQSELYHFSWWHYTLVIDLIGHLPQCFELSLILLKANRIETDFRNRCHPTLVRTHSYLTGPFCEHPNVRC